MPAGSFEKMPCPEKLSPHKLLDLDWLRRRYWDDGATLREIAEEVGSTVEQVRGVMRFNGIPRRPRGTYDRTPLRRAA
jgi:hypothetical protein